MPPGGATGETEPGDRPAGPLSPWWILAGFGLVAGAGLGRAPAAVAAGLLVLLFVGATARHPANGLAALVLAVPFLLGEPKTPYFALEKLIVLGILLSFLVHRLRGALAFTPYHAGALGLLLASTLIALPLDLRGLREDLWVLPAADWLPMLARGVPDVSPLKYADRALVLSLGAGLFLVAAQPAMRGAVSETLRPLAFVVALVAGFGLLRFFDVLQTSGEYLTLSFWTWQHPDRRLTGVAWNPDYMAQFLVLVLPLLLARLWADRPGWGRAPTAAGAVLGLLALAMTFQRAAYAAAVVALGTLALLLRRVGGGGVPWSWTLGGAGLVVGVVAVLDALVLGGRVVARLGAFADDPNRLRLWTTALRMAWDEPLLGVGTGRYAFFFREYGRELAAGFGPFWGTAHSTYLHLLAEQGLLGLLGFVVFFGGVWLGGFRRLRAAPGGPGAVLLAGALAALAGWFAYGLVQFTFRVNALVYLACVLTGTIVALAPPPAGRRWPRPWIAVAATAALVLLAVRTDAALRRPVTAGYEAGLYRWERQGDGRPARWTRRRAAMTLPVRGPVMTLRFRAPLPGIETRPQLVRVFLNYREAGRVRLDGPGWRTLELPVEMPAGSQVLVEMEVAYTFVPSRHAASRDDRTLGVMVGEVAWRDA